MDGEITVEGFVTVGAQLSIGGVVRGDITILEEVLEGAVISLLGRMEGGSLTVRRDAADRRAVNVTVSKKGHNALDRAPSLLQDRFRRELAKLREWERTMTLASLQRIAEMMEAETLEASPVLVAGPVDAAASVSEERRPDTSTTQKDPSPGELHESSERNS